MTSVTLSFTGGKSLVTDAYLILTFDKQFMEGMYSIYNPVVWRVTSFPKGGGGFFQATYTVDLAFTRAQIDDGIVQSAAYSTHIDVGEETTLTVVNPEPPEIYKFSNPVNWSGARLGQFQCHNQTGTFQNIGVGFYQEGHGQPTICLVMNNVPSNTAIPVTFTPKLSAYASVFRDYVENPIIKSKIQSSLDWSLDLSNPSIQKNWVLEENGSQGYMLIPGGPP